MMGACSLPSPGTVIDVAGRIRVVRGQRVLLDSDLAALYGIPTHRLNEAVKRNSGNGFLRTSRFESRLMSTPL